MNPDNVRLVATWLSDASSAVVFTGAGMSTESGIPDFRSPGGVWATNRPVYFEAFLSDPEARREYWRQKAISHQDFASAEPNAGHRILAKWESLGKVVGVITQNIDGLHQAAGSQRVLELHGTARFVGCLQCQARFDAGPLVQRFVETGDPPVCPECGGLTKHATVSFGQSLPDAVLQESLELARAADLFLAMGSSLVVQPAASLPLLASRAGARLVIINRDATPLDHLADQVIAGEIGATLVAIDELLA